MPTTTESLCLWGATVHTADSAQPVIENGEVEITGGRITYVGPTRVERHGAAIDCRGKHLSPGFVEAHAHVGIMPEGFYGEAKDLNEMTRPVTPELKAMDAIWPGDVAFAHAREAGVTTVCVLPGSANVVGGAGVVLKTIGRNVERMALREPACLKVAFGHNVKHSHGLKKGRAPMTRMAIAALFRAAFEGALVYEQQRMVNSSTPADAGQELLLAALRREIPVRAHCSRSDDILTAARLARSFGLKLVIEHGHEAHLVLDELKAIGADVVLGPAFRTCGNSEELRFDFGATKVLCDAGLTVAHMTDHPIVPLQYLPIQAGLCVRAGLDPHRALQTITSGAAKILGVDDRVGRLAEGLDADLLLLSGPPLAIETQVLETYIDGHPIPRHGPLTPGAFVPERRSPAE